MLGKMIDKSEMQAGGKRCDVCSVTANNTVAFP